MVKAERTLGGQSASAAASAGKARLPTGAAAKGAVPAPPPRTITRADLAEAVYASVGLSRAESARFVEDVLNEISDTLVRGENVKISSFGSFIVRAKTERIGRNPKTGVEAPITARRVMVFRPSIILKAKVNGKSTDGLAD
jgi:integration host factor subunit alpha